VGTQPPSAVRREKLDFFGSALFGNRPKNHKAGLVGPAFPLWNWFVGLCWIGKPECLNLGCHRVLLLSRLRMSHSKLRIQVKSFNSKAEPPEPALHHHRQILQLVLEDWDCTTGHFDASCCVECCRGRNPIATAHQEHAK